jgi:hypothetical protein
MGDSPAKNTLNITPCILTPYIYKGGGCLIFPARLCEPQRGSALAGEALVGALRLEIHFLRSARIEPKLFLLSLIYINEY